MHRTAHDRPRDHPDDLTLLAWVHGAVGGSAAEDVDAHLGVCLVCSVRAARLERVEGRDRARPSPEVLDALVAASPGLPRARRRRPRDAPVAHVAPLRLCRLTDGERAAVVYVVEHHVQGEMLTVCPVVFDRSLAEPGAWIVPAASSPLGVEVAVLCAVHVDVPVSLWDAALGVLTDRPVAAPRAASAARPDAGDDLPSSVGVHDEDTIDERRRLVAALASWSRPDDMPASRARAAVLAELAAELPFRWPGARVRDRRSPTTDAAPTIVAVPTTDGAPTIVAVVEDLDAYVYVAIVDGARRPHELTTPAALALAVELCHDGAATAVALVTADGTHAAVLSSDDVALAGRASADETVPPVLSSDDVGLAGRASADETVPPVLSADDVGLAGRASADVTVPPVLSADDVAFAGRASADGTPPPPAVLSADDVALAGRVFAAETVPPVLRTRPLVDALLAYLDHASRPDASAATPLDRRRLEALWHACLLEADEANRAMEELFAEGGL